jgi:DNA replication and repair protein RecF
VRLLRLLTHDFRNLQGPDLDTDADFVVFTGDNAQGKTNALEAIYALATLKPLRGIRLHDVVAWGREEAVVGGTVRSTEGTLQLRVHLGGARRRVLVDGSEERDLSSYFRGIRAIGFTPQDGAIITEGPALRRDWLDRAAFTAAPVHLDRVRNFRRVLAHKAVVLREGGRDEALLDVLDEQLAEAGAVLSHHRAEMLAELAPHVREQHASIAASGTSVELVLRSVCAGRTVTERREALRAALAGARRDEQRRSSCLVGPQKDEVRISLDGVAARHFGSRGQVRSLVLAMKLAELVAARARGDRPLFLLDDLSSELDRGRTGRLVEQLAGLGTQVFITTTDMQHLGGLPSGRTLVGLVRSGEVDLGPGSARSAGVSGRVDRDGASG